MFKIKYYIYDLFRVDKKGVWNWSIQLWEPSTKLTLFTTYSRGSQSANNSIFNTSIIKRFYFELVLWPVLLLHFLFVFVCCCCIFCLLLLPLLFVNGSVAFLFYFVYVIVELFACVIVAILVCCFVRGIVIFQIFCCCCYIFCLSMLHSLFVARISCLLSLLLYLLLVVAVTFVFASFLVICFLYQDRYVPGTTKNRLVSC